VISSSEELLYATDIKYFYMISAPLPDSILPSATRRKLLRQRKIVWQNLKPNIPNDILSMRHASIVAWHSILTQEQIKYVQLPLSAGSDHADTINVATMELWNRSLFFACAGYSSYRH